MRYLVVKMQPLERIAQLHKLSKVFADAQSDKTYLEHFRKSKLALLKIKYQTEDSKRSNATCDDLARADKEYLGVLDGLKEAVRVREAAYWELTISKAGIQIWQTQRADERAKQSIESQLT